jgi:WD40 repeat protein
VWEGQTGKVEKEVETEAAVLALAYAPDGNPLVAGAYTGLRPPVGHRDVAGGILKGHKTEVRVVCLSPNGKALQTGASEEFRVWDRAGALWATVRHPGMVYTAAFNPDGKAVATGGLPSEDLADAVYVRDASDWSGKRRWSGKGGLVGSVAYSPDGKLLASGRCDGAVVILKVK